MSIRKIIKLWILTIVIGSLLAPIVYIPIVLLTKEESWRFISGFFFSWTFVTVIMSTISSIPTILLMIAVSENLNKKKTDLNILDKWLSLCQLTGGLLTFAFLIFVVFFVIWDYLVVTAIVFLATGLIIWKKEIKKMSAQGI